MPVERPVYAFYTRGSQCIKFPFLHFFGIARAMRVWHIGACRVLILVGCDRFSSFLGLLLSGAHNTGEIFFAPIVRMLHIGNYRTRTGVALD